MSNLIVTKVVSLIPLNAADDLMKGVTPNWEIFGSAFHQKWINVVGGFWMLAMGVSVIGLIWGLSKWGWAHHTGMSDDLADGSKRAMRAGLALGVLLALNLVTRAIGAIAL